MSLSKSFLHEVPRPWRQSSRRFVFGIILGLLYGVVFYGFLYCTREVFRIFTITESYDIWLLSEDEVQFYNLFYAFLASILGQSVCFSIWFERPKRIYQRNYRRTINILVDHKVLLWFFLAWFSKLAVGYGLLYAGSYTNAEFYVFSFYPKYNYLFVLIILVLFLQSWTGFLLKYKRSGYKWMFPAALLISLFSFALSKIDIIDYHLLNQRVLQKNIYEKYDLNLPLADYAAVGTRQDRFEQIFMVQNKKSEPIFIMNKEQFPLSGLGFRVLEEKSKRPQELRDIIIFQLNIDLDITMDQIETLKEELANANVHHLHFGVVPKDHQLDVRYYRNNYFMVANSAYYRGFNYNLDKHTLINVKPTPSGNYMVNGLAVAKKELRTNLRSLLVENPDYAILLEIKSNMSFNTYFNLVNNAHAAVLDLRETYCKNTFDSTFENLSRSNKLEAMNEYPLRLLEVRKGEFPQLEAYMKNAPPQPPRPWN